MTDDIIYPIADAEQLMQDFLQCTLDKYDWTHEAHLVVGLYMVTHYPQDALTHMREAIKRFNLATGTANTETSGYHETLTVFWLEHIRANCTANDGSLTWDQETLNHLLVNRALTNRNIWLEHYTEEAIRSVEARLHYVAPER